MIGTVVRALVLIPLAVVLVIFAVANRQPVVISLDPFDRAAPAYAATMPLFVVVILMLIVGVVVGGIATFITQGRWRRAARRHEARARELQMQLDAVRGSESDVPARPRAPLARPRLTFPPPAA